jgi:hypothetical protein
MILVALMRDVILSEAKDLPGGQIGPVFRSRPDPSVVETPSG